MKRKLLMLTALALCLALLCGCTTIATSEWMQNLFPVGDEAVAAQQTGSVNGSEDKQEVKQVVTETYTALESFGLAYQPDYGLQPYNCQSQQPHHLFLPLRAAVRRDKQLRGRTDSRRELFCH